jgi:flagellar biogenesis protein FliO
MPFASSNALHVLTLAVDAVLLIAIVGGGIYAFRRMRRHDD